MNLPAIALFGEAEKGSFNEGIICDKVPELMDYFGNPPADSLGLHYAVQALLYQYQLIFFRVMQEGFSKNDYVHGINILAQSPMIHSIHAICTPGVGDPSIINILIPLCLEHHQILITNERDLYDYLTAENF